jgi:hypothetical protein
MIAFIKNYNLEAIKKKIILLYLLNVTDIIFTILLLQTGYFAEVNIFMVKTVQSPIASILLKVIFPAMLLYFIYKEMKTAEDQQLRVSNIAVTISLTIYSLVNLTHLVWVALLPVFIYLY